MVCTHLAELYKYVRKNKLKITAADLMTIECNKCQDKDSCDVID